MLDAEHQMQQHASQRREQTDPQARPQHDELVKQQRWLLLFRHCAKCAVRDGPCCYDPCCSTVKQLWQHIRGCLDAACTFTKYALPVEGGEGIGASSLLLS